MKLGKVTSNDPVGRKAINFHLSTTTQLEAYQAYYQSIHGDEISLSQLVEEIAKRFLKDDRDFQKFFAKKPAATSADAPVAPLAPSSGTLSVKK
jgi:hypothetical protein